MALAVITIQDDLDDEGTLDIKLLMEPPVKPDGDNPFALNAAVAAVHWLQDTLSD